MLVVNVVQFIVFGLNFIFLCFHTRPYLSIYAMEIRTTAYACYFRCNIFSFVFLERLSFPVSLRGPIPWRLTRPIF